MKLKKNISSLIAFIFLGSLLAGCGSGSSEYPGQVVSESPKTPEPAPNPEPVPNPNPKAPPYLDLPLAATPPKKDPKMPDPVASDAFVDSVVEFNLGLKGGYGQESLPNVVLGAPEGNIDVLSLGKGGSIVLKSETPILNGPGVDFIVFENPFNILGKDPNVYKPFAELAQVSVSQDGVDFIPFPCDLENEEALYPGCAGVREVTPADDLQNSGGDAFDLEDLHLAWVQYIRIEDQQFPSWGDAVDGGGKAGFDLDAVGILHQ